MLLEKSPRMEILRRITSFPLNMLKDSHTNLRAWWLDGDLEIVEPVQEATTQVKTHTARSRLGKVFTVRQHARQVTAANKMKLVGATENEDTYLRKLLARHDPKVLAAVPFVAVMNRKDFMRATKKTDPLYKADGTEVGWYDELKGHIVLNRTAMTGAADWKAVLDHEMGHAAYYHSPRLNDWEKASQDPKFDRFTWYAKQEGPHEGYAETYMAYIAAGGKAKQPKHKQAFAMVRKVLSAVNPKVNRYEFGSR